ncbi:hypothetical protein FSP39_018917 [Pinctada imbricata]|uniref:Uncharacterized protein n=1 Tax=Pinctada imbricata TaxID=66713 RepID=A0AA88XMZ5_PINIB|nr:hypothetical protein FSP39_018917 [Pinctada imbricata]
MNNFALTVDYRHRKIFQIDINNGSNINAIDLDESARPVAATYFNQHIYWSDYETDKLHMSNMSGGNTSTIYNMELSLCFSLAVDPSTGNVYYVGVPYTRPTKPAYLAVVHPGTSKHKRLLDEIEIAGGIALYPSKGLMFWSDQGDDDYSGRIERASMDGKNRKSLFPYGLPHPVSIAVGYRENKIYWTDALDDSINYCDLDGSNKGVLYNDVNVRMNHIAVGPSNVFYNAHNVQRVMKLNKNTEKPQVWMNKQPEMGRLESLDVFVDGYSIPGEKTLITSTVAPIITTLMPGVMENLSQISSGTFAGVIVAVVSIFMIIILGLIFVMFRRRALKMPSNGKFLSARSIPPLENIIVSRDGDFDHLDEKDTHEPKSSNGTPALADDGMENPLYFEKNTERKNKNPYVTTIDVSKM